MMQWIGSWRKHPSLFAIATKQWIRRRKRRQKPPCIFHFPVLLLPSTARWRKEGAQSWRVQYSPTVNDDEHPWIYCSQWMASGKPKSSTYECVSKPSSILSDKNLKLFFSQWGSTLLREIKALIGNKSHIACFYGVVSHFGTISVCEKKG